jgi:hypothetical protein
MTELPCDHGHWNAIHCQVRCVGKTRDAEVTGLPTRASYRRTSSSSAVQRFVSGLMSWPAAWVERTRAPSPAATLILQVKIAGGGARNEEPARLPGICASVRPRRCRYIREIQGANQEGTSLRPNQRRYQTGRVLESVNHGLILRQIFAARRPRDYDFFVA